MKVFLGLLMKQQIIRTLKNTVQPCSGDPDFCERLEKDLQEKILSDDDQVHTRCASSYWSQEAQEILTLTRLSGEWQKWL